jgi:hypothetical protein
MKKLLPGIVLTLVAASAVPAFAESAGAGYRGAWYGSLRWFPDIQYQLMVGLVKE